MAETPGGPLRVEALGAQHDRSTFVSGAEALDRYFRAQAGQEARKNIAAPFVLVLPDGAIGGYGLVIPTVHVAGAPTHIAWYWVDTLSGVDKVQAALRGAREKRSGEQNATLDARAGEIFEPGAHFDDLLEVTMSGVK